MERPPSPQRALNVTNRKGCEQSDLALGVAPRKNCNIINLYINSGLSGVGSHKRNKLEVIYYDLDLDLGCGSPSPRSLYRPVSPVDWLETAERELYNTGKSSSEGQSPSGVILSLRGWSLRSDFWKSNQLHIFIVQKLRKKY